jgi:hypothetical protein
MVESPVNVVTPTARAQLNQFRLRTDGRVAAISIHGNRLTFLVPKKKGAIARAFRYRF